MERDSVVRKFRTTAADGKAYDVEHYNLDMIISLGYRIKSKIATKFRIWATERLREYIVKGFTIDSDRLKNWVAGIIGKNYSMRFEIFALGIRIFSFFGVSKYILGYI